MTQIFRQLQCLTLLILLCSSSVFAQPVLNQGAFQPYGEGMPLPWPFPWAKDCPVDWDAMDGRYLLTDSMAGDQIDLKITIISESVFRLVRVTRYSSDGKMLSDGMIKVDKTEKTVELWLYPTNRTELRTRAILRLYYGSPEMACSEDKLIPILTLDQPESPNSIERQYRLMRVSESRE